MQDFAFVATLDSGLKATVRKVTLADFEVGNRFNVLYEWLVATGKYMKTEFSRADREDYRKRFFEGLASDNNVLLGAFSFDTLVGMA